MACCFQLKRTREGRPEHSTYDMAISVVECLLLSMTSSHVVLSSTLSVMYVLLFLDHLLV